MGSEKRLKSRGYKNSFYFKVESTRYITNKKSPTKVTNTKYFQFSYPRCSIKQNVFCLSSSNSSCIARPAFYVIFKYCHTSRKLIFDTKSNIPSFHTIFFLFPVGATNVFNYTILFSLL